MVRPLPLRRPSLRGPAPGGTHDGLTAPLGRASLPRNVRKEHAPMLPLQGVKVLEIGQNLAGPYASEILGMLGAEVVKIERPEGDDARGWGPPFVAGIATSFHAVNRNKRSVVLDLKDPAAVAWLKEFVQRRDVLVQNMRPGLLA